MKMVITGQQCNVSTILPMIAENYSTEIKTKSNRPYIVVAVCQFCNAGWLKLPRVLTRGFIYQSIYLLLCLMVEGDIRWVPINQVLKGLAENN